MNLIELRKPIPLKWRVQRPFPNKTNPTHLIMTGYIDSRDVQSRLDDVVGPENWSSQFYAENGILFCKIGIRTDTGEWVFKADAGGAMKGAIDDRTADPHKSAASDAFKRAAVHWGINRIAYLMPEVKVPAKEYGNKFYPCDEKGKFLKGNALNDWCNNAADFDSFEMAFETIVAKEEEEEVSNGPKDLFNGKFRSNVIK